MKRVLIYMILAVAVLVALIVSGGFYLVSFALQPAEFIAERNAQSYAYMKETYPHIAPWLDSLQTTPGVMRDTTIRGQEGELLHARYIAARERTSRTAVIVHGYTDNSLRMMMIGYMYHNDLGYNILLPDLHYHGKSEGRAVRMGWKDRIDVLRWMEVANDIFGGDTQMVVHGISMGAATTMMLSGEEQQPFVKCFVEDCGYTSAWDEFDKELGEQFGLPSFPLLNVASGICQWKYGWNFKEASALEQVRKCKLPMLFIHGDNDTFVPTWMVHPLYEAKEGDKELWLAPGSTHAMAYRDHSAEYTQRVASFVGRYIR